MSKKVQTLADFVSIVESICSEWDCLSSTTHPWFRGQAEASWNLVPGLYRGWVDSFYERELLRDFRLRSSSFLDHSPANDLEWLFVMQHYGMPTRLLDWTESHLFALYFAVSDGKHSGDAGVWVLDPWSINDRAIGMESVPIADHPSLTAYTLNPGRDRLGRKIKAIIPAAVRPPRSTPRIIAQKGTFTIHGSSASGLDVLIEEFNKEDDGAEIRLRKIIVDGSQKKQLLKQLYLAGMSEGGLFPDLVGLCGEISYRYSAEYLEEMRELAEVKVVGAQGSGSSKSSSKKSYSHKKARSNGDHSRVGRSFSSRPRSSKRKPTKKRKR